MPVFFRNMYININFRDKLVIILIRYLLGSNLNMCRFVLKDCFRSSLYNLAAMYCLNREFDVLFMFCIEVEKFRGKLKNIITCFITFNIIKYESIAQSFIFIVDYALMVVCTVFNNRLFIN